LTFQTAIPTGGSNTFSYGSKGTAWEPTPFTHGPEHAVPIGGAKFVLKPTERVGEFIRPTFYGDTSASRDAMVRAKRSSLLNPSKKEEFLSEGNPAEEVAKGYKIDPATGRASVLIGHGSPGPRSPDCRTLDKPWRNNTKQAIREVWNRSTGTYKIMSLALNRSRGSRGATFTEEVGMNFRGPGE
jgi:hypothetical protein